MTCPDDIVLMADPLTDSNDVQWNLPSDVNDNSGIDPIITSSHTPPARFYLGQSVVSFQATDTAGLTTSCSFTVTIKGRVRNNIVPLISTPVIHEVDRV